MYEDKILELVKKDNPENPIDYVHNIVKDFAMDKLNNYILSCNDCSISDCNKKTIPYGNSNASIMIISESISQDQMFEDENIIYPLADSSGQELSNVLNKINVNKDELFLINSVNCFPYRKQGNDIIKRSPTKTERTNCSAFLNYAIKIVQPLLIICLGGVAINGINEEIGKQSVSKIRGNFFYYRGIPVMPTYHPGYFKEIKGKIDEDLLNIYKGEFYNDIETAFKYIQDLYPDIEILKGV